MKTDSFTTDDGLFLIAASSEEKARQEAEYWHPESFGWEVVDVQEIDNPGKHRYPALFSEIISEGGRIYRAIIRDNVDIFILKQREKNHDFTILDFNQYRDGLGGYRRSNDLDG